MADALSGFTRAELQLILTSDTSQLDQFQRAVREAMLADQNLFQQVSEGAKGNKAELTSLVAAYSQLTGAATNAANQQKQISAGAQSAAEAAAAAIHAEYEAIQKESQLLKEQAAVWKERNNAAAPAGPQLPGGFQSYGAFQLRPSTAPAADTSEAAQSKLVQAYAASQGGITAYSKGIQDADEKLDHLSKTTVAGTGNVIQFGKGVASGVLGLSLLGGGALLAGRAITQFVVDSVKRFQDLEAEAQNLATVQIGFDTQSAEQSLQRLQSEVPATLKQISESYYEVASVGGQAAQVSEELTRIIATGAQVARADTKAWTDDVIGSLNAWNLWGQTAQETYANAQDVQAKFFQAAKDSIGTPAQLAQAWGPVALAVQQAGGSIDDALALIVGASHGVGEFSQNITNLQRFLNDLNTDKAQQALTTYGVAVRNADGSNRTAIQVLQQLQDKLQGFSQGQKAAVLEQLFPQERATRGVQNLLENLDSISGEYEKLKGAGKGWADAQNTYLDTAKSRTTELRNEFQKAQEQFGDFVSHAPEAGLQFLGWLEDAAHGAEKLGKALRGEPLEPVAPQPGPTPGSQNFIGPLSPAQTQIKNASNQFKGAVREDATTLRDSIQSSIDDAVNNAAAGFEVQIRQKIGQSFVKDAFGDLPQGVQDIFTDAASKAGESINSNFPQVVATMAHYAAEIQNLIQQMLSADPAAAEKIKAQIQAIMQEAEGYAKQNIDTLDPAGADRRAQQRADAEEKAKELPLQQKANELEKNLYNLRQQNSDIMDGLRAKQSALNDTLRTAEINLYQIQKHWQDIDDKHAQTLANIQKDKNAALGTSIPGSVNATGITKQLQDDQTALTAYTQQADDQMHDLNNRLYEMDRTARETTRTLIVGFDAAGNAIMKTVTVVQTLESRLKASTGLNEWTSNAGIAQKGLDDLAKAAEHARQAFDDAQNSLDDMGRAIDDQFRGPIGQAQAEVDTFNQALATLAHNEELELRPINDAIAGLQGRLQGANAQLTVLQTRLRALQELDRQAKAEEDLRNRQTGIENLRGRLVGATGAERAGLQDQLNRQEAAQGRAIEENTLQQQIAQQQQVIDKINAEITAQQQLAAQIQRKYELESRGIKDNLYNAQQHLDQLNREKKLHDDIREAAQRRLDADERAAARRTEMSKRQIQEELAWAKEQGAAAALAVSFSLDVWNNLRGYINNTLTDEGHYFDEHKRQFSQQVFNDELGIKAVTLYYDGLKGAEDAARLKDIDLGKAAVQAAKDTVTAITAPDGPLAALQNQITKEGETATAAEKRAQREIAAITGPNGTLTALQQEYTLLGQIKTIYDQLNGGRPTGTSPNGSGNPGGDSRPPTTGTKTIGDNFGSAFGIIGGGTPTRTPVAPTPVAASAGTQSVVSPLVIYGDVQVTSPLPTSPAQVAQFAATMRTAIRPAQGRSRVRA